MTYYSPFTGPFSPFPIPSNVLLTEPATDNTIDIGTPTKRYRRSYIVDMVSTTSETGTLTATTVHTTGLTSTTGTITTLTASTVNTTGVNATTGSITTLTAPTLTTTTINGAAATYLVEYGATSPTTTGNVTTFINPPVPGTGNSAYTIIDSGIPLNEIVKVSSSFPLVSEKLAMGFGPDSVRDSQIVAADVVTCTGTSTTGNLCKYTSTTGRVIEDAGINTSQILTGNYPSTQFVTRLYQQIDVMFVGNTITETSITAGAVHLGTLVVPAGRKKVGTSVRLQAYVRIDTGGDTVIFNVKCNGNVLATSVAIGGGMGVLDFFALLTSATENTNSLATNVNGSVFTNNQFAVTGWDVAGASTFDITATWSAADPGDNLEVDTVNMDVTNFN